MAMMGLAKTIEAVSCLRMAGSFGANRYTLGRRCIRDRRTKAYGCSYPRSRDCYPDHSCYPREASHRYGNKQTPYQPSVAHCIRTLDLFDAMFSLVDIFTFTLRAITPSMWPMFESMYKLFKSIAVDYLDGQCCGSFHVSIMNS
jgi:hypothetical protein